ncbi:MAG: pilus assembly protein TadG-related protein [Solirubrobacteraceae bacterium]
MALVAVSIVALLGMAALAIDLSSLYQAQKQAQTAADAGALAATQDLPSNTTGAANDGTTYAQENYRGATVTVATNYAGNANRVKVTVNATAPTFFAKIFGFNSAAISASAIGGEHGKSMQAAIFAYADGGNCSTDIGIKIDKNNAQITGALQSNGNLTDSGGGNTSIGAGVYGTGSGCAFSGNTGHYATAPFASPPTPYPLDYRNFPPTCTNYVTGTYVFTGTVAPGVYCNTTGSIDFSGATGTGVTFVANKIGATSGATLTGPMVNGAYGLLLYQTGCDDSPGPGPMQISGNGETLDGTIFAPCATVDINNNNSSTGFIEANNVQIFFNNFHIVGDGPVVPGTGGGLLG